ncbi:MAG: alanine dehydrogenase [Candidatus Portnoybacteria bacterium]|nr:alanine dehydrogenase [Candidatus Portnoybacteria bacterium]
MLIGVPKEIKNNEQRVAITPIGVKALVATGHRVVLEAGAGFGSGISDQNFVDAGVSGIFTEPELIWRAADLILKVKEPVGPELEFLKYLKGKTLFTYLHLSGVSKELTEALLRHKVAALAYETVEGKRGGLPLLRPMSEVAGVIAVEEGAHYLKRQYGGRGITLGRITGVKPATVVVVGGGTAGVKAAETAAGMGASVILFEVNYEKIMRLRVQFAEEGLLKRINLMQSDEDSLMQIVPWADLLIGAVLVPGAAAPKIITKEMIAKMKTGSVVVDISIDQGGCTELSRPTTHSEPTYRTENGVIFYCVTNMPGQASLQSTYALTSATLPYLLKIAEGGLETAVKNDPGLAKGVNTYEGHITYEQVAKDLEMTGYYKPLEELLK